VTAYLVSPNARDDLNGIWDYIAADNVLAADNLIAEIESAFELLVRHPGIGHPREDISDRSLRIWPVHRYLIIYRPDTSPIEVVRILHGHRDIGRIMG
jgi:plasmid stabilization system protein ParE